MSERSRIAVDGTMQDHRNDRRFPTACGQQIARIKWHNKSRAAMALPGRVIPGIAHNGSTEILQSAETDLPRYLR